MYEQRINSISKSRKKSALNTSLHSSNSYNLDLSKTSSLNLELERTKDTIIKLKSELIEKNKEIAMLKVKNVKQEREMQKTFKNLDDIMKNIDKETLVSISMLNKTKKTKERKNRRVLSQGNIHSKNNFLYESIDEDNSNHNNNSVMDESNENLPPLKDMIHFTEEQKRSMKNIIEIKNLKKKISDQETTIKKKDNEIYQLKTNKKATLYSKLENNYVKNYTELSLLKKQNETMYNKYEDLYYKYQNESKAKNDLQQRFEGFKQNHYLFKQNIAEENKRRNNSLKLVQQIADNCRIFHSNHSSSKDNSLKEAKKEMSKLHNEINSLEKEKSDNKEVIENLMLLTKSLKLENKNLRKQLGIYEKQINHSKHENKGLKSKILNMENNNISQDLIECKNNNNKNEEKLRVMYELFEENEKEKIKLKEENEKLKNIISSLKKKLNQRQQLTHNTSASQSQGTIFATSVDIKIKSKNHQTDEINSSTLNKNHLTEEKNSIFNNNELKQSKNSFEHNKSNISIKNTSKKEDNDEISEVLNIETITKEEKNENDYCENINHEVILLEDLIKFNENDNNTENAQHEENIDQNKDLNKENSMRYENNNNIKKSFYSDVEYLDDQIKFKDNESQYSLSKFDYSNKIRKNKVTHKTNEPELLENQMKFKDNESQFSITKQSFRSLQQNVSKIPQYQYHVVEYLDEQMKFKDNESQYSFPRKSISNFKIYQTPKIQEEITFLNEQMKFKDNESQYSFPKKGSTPKIQEEIPFLDEQMKFKDNESQYTISKKSIDQSVPNPIKAANISNTVEFLNEQMKFKDNESQYTISKKSMHQTHEHIEKRETPKVVEFLDEQMKFKDNESQLSNSFFGNKSNSQKQLKETEGEVKEIISPVSKTNVKCLEEQMKFGENESQYSNQNDKKSSKSSRVSSSAKIKKSTSKSKDEEIQEQSHKQEENVTDKQVVPEETYFLEDQMKFNENESRYTMSVYNKKNINKQKSISLHSQNQNQIEFLDDQMKFKDNENQDTRSQKSIIQTNNNIPLKSRSSKNQIPIEFETLEERMKFKSNETQSSFNKDSIPNNSVKLKMMYSQKEPEYLKEQMKFKENESQYSINKQSNKSNHSPKSNCKSPSCNNENELNHSCQEIIRNLKANPENYNEYINNMNNKVKSSTPSQSQNQDKSCSNNNTKLTKDNNKNIELKKTNSRNDNRINTVYKNLKKNNQLTLDPKTINNNLKIRPQSELLKINYKKEYQNSESEPKSIKKLQQEDNFSSLESLNIGNDN